ncbi:RluA family pseudouridine synthase [Aciduricibacillus chroicocephali]|uniref:Pseudouridine synthase n=1 Tax=Aciduricibacillus chroicocephali TaxID=3054939 RepID=A0ABY9KWB1_9BACI|nr:RluA family pseudouridine synthase [Bacillaceae bacterium 44XB]
MANEWRINEQDELLKFLYKALSGKSRNSVKSILSRGQVVLNGKVTTQFNEKLQPGDKVQIKNRVVPEDVKLRGVEIVYEDEDLMVVEKAAGLLTIATDTEKQATAYRELTYYLRRTQPKRQLFIVHRLDRDTSGLLIFAKNKETQQALQNAWKENVKERTYLALVEGHVAKDGTISSWLTEGKGPAHKMHSSQKDNGGKKAITHYKVAKASRDMSLLEVNLETGRKNQIRVHMQDIGHPVVGDKKYGARLNPLRRLGLHAYAISFVHPKTGKTLRFESDVPKDFLKMFFG